MDQWFLYIVISQADTGGRPGHDHMVVRVAQCGLLFVFFCSIYDI